MRNLHKEPDRVYAMNNFSLWPALGSIVSVRVWGVTHCGIICGYDQYGEPVVISISLWNGFVQETLDDFLGGMPWESIEYPSDLPEWEVVARAYSVADKPYDLASWNCEHFVRFAHGLRPSSPQFNAALILAGVVAVAALAARA